jgi:hypothetical protein
MSKKALSDLLDRWVNGTGRVNATPPARSRNRARLRPEEVENRVVPASDPAPHAQSRPVIVL